MNWGRLPPFSAAKNTNVCLNLRSCQQVAGLMEYGYKACVLPSYKDEWEILMDAVSQT